MINKYINIYLYATLLCISHHLFFAMEIVTDIIRPTHVACLRNKTYAVAGSNGLVFFNKKTQEHTHVQKNNKIDDLAVNNDQTMVATSSDGVITVYDAITKEIAWSYDTCTHQFTPITFNSQFNQQLIAHVSHDRLKRFISPTFALQTLTYETNTIIPTPICCHPHKQDVSYIVNQPVGKCFIYMCHVNSGNNKQCEAQHQIANNCKTTSGYNPFLGYSYSPNYKYSVTIKSHNFFLLSNLITNSILYWWPTDYKSPAIEMMAAAFHPNSSILAVLTHNYVLEYYQVTHPSPCSTKILIPLEQRDTALDTISIEPPKNLDLIGKRIAFSPNGKHLLVALANKCFLLPIPRQMLYTENIIHQLVFYFFMLKNINEKPNLIDDVVYRIIKKQLLLFRLFPDKEHSFL